MADAVPDKTLAPLRGKAVIRYAIEAFLQSGCVGRICVVYRDDVQKQAIAATLLDLDRGEVELLWARGGPTRQASVLNGLEALPGDPGFVFIHDGARPLVRPHSISALLELAVCDGAACLAHRVVDTIKRTSAPHVSGCVTLEDLERDRLWAMETPQVFRHSDILQAYRELAASGTGATDDAAAATAIGLPVSLLDNPHPNPKITTPADLAYLEWLLSQ